MVYRDAFRRAVATFVFGAFSSPFSAAVFSVDAWKVAASAGVAAVINLAYRSAEAYLKSFPESEV